MAKVLLVDGHPLNRLGLRSLLTSRLMVSEIGEAGSIGEAVFLMRNGPWDLVVIDLELPGADSLNLIKRIRNDWSRTSVLVLTGSDEVTYGMRALRAGVAGYLHKSASLAEVVTAISRVLEGHRHISQGLANLVAGQLSRGADLQPNHRLTDREFQVVRMIAKGAATSEIAIRLSLSTKTIYTHRSRALRKMGLRNNAEIASYAYREKLVE